jgi:hypothetical protein
MPEALQGLPGFVAIIAVIAAAVFVIAVIARLNEIGIFAILLNAVIAFVGLGIIVEFGASPIGWLIGSIPLMIGGFNLYHMVPNLIKHGTADPLD